MTERRRGRAVPPKEPAKEPTPEGPYYRSARYAGERDAGVVYDQAQALIYRTPCDLSAFRLQLSSVWHVVVLGTAPPTDLAQQVTQLLATGEPAVLPDQVLTRLLARRARATRIGPWVEGHYRTKRGRK